MEKTCFPYYSYMLINPSAQLIIDGFCKEGCEPGDNIEYKYRFYTGQSSTYLNQIWEKFHGSLSDIPSISFKSV
jgi:hypothetical protein